MKKLEGIHISQIRVGDTVMHDGKLRTVCSKNLKWSNFMGYSLFGDTYRLGTVLVKREVKNGKCDNK